MNINVVVLASLCSIFAACSAPTTRKKPTVQIEPAPLVTTGEFTGVIAQRAGAKITVRNAQAERSFLPQWRGGATKDGGGFDRQTLRLLDLFSVGDSVNVQWVYVRNYRIEAMELAPQPPPAK